MTTSIFRQFRQRHHAHEYFLSGMTWHLSVIIVAHMGLFLLYRLSNFIFSQFVPRTLRLHRNISSLSRDCYSTFLAPKGEVYEQLYADSERTNSHVS